MSYEVGIRAQPTEIPFVKWNRKTCVECGEQLWVPGKRTDLPAACSDHSNATLIGSHNTYLESVTSIQ